MRLQVLGFVGVLVMLSAVAPADVRKELEAQQEAFKKAVLTKDGSWFDKTAAKDFQQVELNGKVTKRAASIAMMKEMFKSGDTTKADVKITKIAPKGKLTVVTTETHFVMSMKMGGAPKPSKMESWVTYEETWSKEGGKWMIHQLKSLKEKMTMDGKPIPPGAMGG